MPSPQRGPSHQGNDSKRPASCESDEMPPVKLIRKDEDEKVLSMVEGNESFSPSHHINHTTRQEYINELGRTGEVHQFYIEQLPQTDSDDYAHEALPLLFEVIKLILKKATENYEADDLIKLEILHPEWPQHYVQPFDAVATLDAEHIMDRIEDRFFENNNFNLYGNYTFVLTCVGKFSFKPDDFVQVKKVTERKVKKFGVKGLDYEIKVSDLNEQVQSVSEVGFKIETILQHVIKKITIGEGSNCMVRLVLMHSALDKPLSLPFMNLSELTGKRVMDEISKILQSKSEFDLLLGFSLHIVIVHLPHGGRNKRVYANWEAFKKDSKSIVRIINTTADKKANLEQLCCARAIVVGKEYADNGPDQDKIRRSDSRLQRDRAIELHQATGVPLGPCGLQEIQKFQDYYEGFYQINVISFHQNFEKVFHGPPAPNQINIVYSFEHYDVITTMTGFLNKTYYCNYCHIAFNEKSKDHCKDYCRFCQRKECH